MDDGSICLLSFVFHPFFPSAGFGYFIDAFAQAAGRDRQMISCLSSIIDNVLAAHLGGIESQVVRNLIELHFQAKARLRRAVSPFGSTRWLVCEHS